ncbi:MAG TPA: ABC transporter ATP-binding protein/permease [Pseudolabrys sp.]|uniref:ABC transporter ATP-binding protein/permease n=1 Tax=Pseudolabrys sp. TaxID=1960880 RepID=UPI002DDCD479|nr:ABC transporter ATP-binding protein/permease [Pseudolabrys sp.]HEV2628348.1 ABC transporter ATP-binding protein/permease [Pseudolabrys sp.]
MRGMLSTLATVWRIASPYFSSEDRWAGRILFAAVVAIELSIVGLTVLYNSWNNAFYNALQERNWNVFVYQLGYFCVIAAAFVALAVYQLYLNQWLQIRWRRWLTRVYLGDWLEHSVHYRMQLQGDAADNPDQRISEDIRSFIELTLTIGLQVLNSTVTLISFMVILWSLSQAAPLSLFGVNIPGYLLWAAFVYAVFGTALTHLIGRPLVALNFQQQRYEADFRFNLVRVRENSEQIALLEGDEAERERLLMRFGNVVANWYALMTRQKKLTFFTASYSQAAVVFPFIMVSPAYFANKLQLGGLMQTANAFGQVQSALSVFVSLYRSLAEWSAVIERLSGFEQSVASARRLAATSGIVIDRGEGKAVAFKDLAVRLPDGVPLVNARDVSIELGEHVLLSGPSGTGKSTLFRALAGVWPFGEGHITLPKDARVMILPQRPYFPIAPLAAAVAYPAETGHYDAEKVAELIAAVGLPGLVDRIGEEAHWNRMLSPGEQQRLGIARALVHAPDFLFLDEATASLDEAAEATLYRLLQQRLPHATVVSIGHRSTLAAFHKRRLALVHQGDHHVLSEASLTPAE